MVSPLRFVVDVKRVGGQRGAAVVPHLHQKGGGRGNHRRGPTGGARWGYQVRPGAVPEA